MDQGRLMVYYSTAFPRYADRQLYFERRDAALARSFRRRYEIWLAVHSLLLHQDEQEGLLSGAASDVSEEIGTALERRERCRLAALAAMVAAREVLGQVGPVSEE
jgi:hypothetical protein